MGLLVLFLFINSYIFKPCQSINMLGPADLIYKSFGNCEPKLTDVDLWITQRKYNRTTNVVDIRLATPWPVDDDMILKITAEIKKEGGYKPGSFYMKDTMCTVFSTLLGDVFYQFLEVAGTEDCPMPEGDYDIKDFYFDNDKFTVPSLYGEYRASLLIHKGEELKGCYFLFLDMVPKEE